MAGALGGEAAGARLARLRGRERARDAEAVAAWMAQTRGLAAPAPPGDGPLAPNGTGWLVGAGGTIRRLFPRGARVADSTVALAAFWPAVAGWLGLQPAGLSALVGIALLVGLALSPWLALRTWSARHLRRQLAAAACIGRPDDAPPGTLVRLTGVVVDQPTVPSLFLGRPSVLFRNRLGLADEVRGIDFVIECEGGERLRVSARDAVLMDPPVRTPWPPACGPVVASAFGSPFPHLRPAERGARLGRLSSRRAGESSVGPGDRVEVAGLLERGPAPDGSAVPGRGTPLASRLRAAPGGLLIVRKV
jgi:hypothetical protein